MVNRWVEFVKEYVEIEREKGNDMTYGCAISLAGPAYRKKYNLPEPKKKPKKKPKKDVNRWVKHVRKYAKDNNVSYGCAIKDARATYIKVRGKPKAKPKPVVKAEPKPKPKANLGAELDIEQVNRRIDKYLKQIDILEKSNNKNKESEIAKLIDWVRRDRNLIRNSKVIERKIKQETLEKTKAKPKAKPKPTVKPKAEPKPISQEEAKKFLKAKIKELEKTGEDEDELLRNINMLRHLEGKPRISRLKTPKQPPEVRTFKEAKIEHIDYNPFPYEKFIKEMGFKDSKEAKKIYMENFGSYTPEASQKLFIKALENPKFTTWFKMWMDKYCSQNFKSIGACHLWGDEMFGMIFNKLMDEYPKKNDKFYYVSVYRASLKLVNYILTQINNRWDNTPIKSMFINRNETGSRLRTLKKEYRKGLQDEFANLSKEALMSAFGKEAKRRPEPKPTIKPKTKPKPTVKPKAKKVVYVSVKELSPLEKWKQKNIIDKKITMDAIKKQGATVDKRKKTFDKDTTNKRNRRNWEREIDKLILLKEEYEKQNPKPKPVVKARKDHGILNFSGITFPLYQGDQRGITKEEDERENIWYKNNILNKKITKEALKKQEKIYVETRVIYKKDRAIRKNEKELTVQAERLRLMRKRYYKQNPEEKPKPKKKRTIIV